MFKSTIILISLLASLNAFGQTTIKAIQGEQEDSPYDGQEVTIKGIVTGASPSAPGYFVQDDYGAWSGIYVYDPKRDPMPAIGDEILITGAVSEYYNLTEISSLSSFEVISSNNPLPEAIEISSGESMLEKYEGVLVKVLNATCTNKSLGYGEWEINDGSGAIVINDFFYAFTPDEGVSYSVCGPLDYSFEAFKIEPRTADDITINAPVFFTQEPKQVQLAKSSITVQWETNTGASSVVQYGKTSDLEMGTIQLNEQNTLHKITIDGLEAGELYYLYCYSVLDNDTTPSYLRSYTTVSNSSGTMNIVFTIPEYKLLVGNVNDEQQLKSATFSMADTIASYINKANSTLDIAIYDVINHAPQSDQSNQKIFDAILAKAASGVQVRLITDDTSTDPFFTELLKDGHVMWGNTDAIMHNKFIVVDAQSETNSWVITGSTNWTYNNLVMDANNLLAIQDRSLAKAYTVEFNEMWGGPQNEPNYSTGKFGNQKSNNTPHQFLINEIPVELYFSPSDKTENQIIKAIESADYEILFNILAFTSDPIRIALIEAHNRGVVVKGVIDYVEYSGSEFDALLEAGIDVLDYRNHTGLSWPEDVTIHHKFMVIDYMHVDSDPLLVTGTHNWSASAESRNDENTLIIHNMDIAQLYMAEAENVYMMSNPSSAVKDLLNKQPSVYPNPANNWINVYFDEPVKSIQLMNINGQSLNMLVDIEGKLQTFNTSRLKPGTYILIVTDQKNRQYQRRFVKF